MLRRRILHVHLFVFSRWSRNGKEVLKVFPPIFPSTSYFTSRRSGSIHSTLPQARTMATDSLHRPGVMVTTNDGPSVANDLASLTLRLTYRIYVQEQWKQISTQRTPPAPHGMGHVFSPDRPHGTFVLYDVLRHPGISGDFLMHHFKGTHNSSRCRDAQLMLRSFVIFFKGSILSIGNRTEMNRVHVHACLVSA